MSKFQVKITLWVIKILVQRNSKIVWQNKTLNVYVIYPYYYYHFILKVKSENPTEFGIHTPLLDGSNAIFVLECSLR